MVEEADPPARAVRVAVHLPLDRLLTYAVPEDMPLRPGCGVLVPLGPQTVAGTVIEEADPAEVPRLRPVRRLLDPEPVLDAAQLRFLRWAADYYLCGLGEMIATALPVAYRARTRRTWRPTPDGVAHLADREGLGADEPARVQVLREVVARPGLTTRGLARRLRQELEPDAVRRALESLRRAGLVARVEEAPAAPGQRRRRVRLKVPAREIPGALGARMAAVVAALEAAGGEADLAELAAEVGGSARDAVRRLEGRGILAVEQVEDRAPARIPDLGPSREAPPEPNADQARAIAAITGSEPRPWLLHGVTGSGKTEVYLRVAERVLAEGRQVLVLVPEIALTPLLTGRFRARFGGATAVLHSGLTGAERLREWRRIRAGEARVAVGARSAIFAPFRDLGLIVVDEEHDDSYKQGEAPRYHARDLAVVRGRQLGCPVVLGSATPSLESWRNAREGRYGLLRLPRRATPRPVPAIDLVDLRGQPADSHLSAELVEALDETFAAGGKAIVLVNRRGFAPVVECPGCGAGFHCPSCGVALVLHRRARRLRCHYCGYHQPYEPTCPACGGELAELGLGTQRVEEELAERFAEVGVLRMDADTTAGRHAHHRLLSRFRDGEARLLVGTQLVAKGHDFRDVQLAAVVGVDHMLNFPDFRSAERTWALVTQLAGRAGRGDVPGRVLVQTRHPDHFVFRVAVEGVRDPDAFYTEEARVRRIFAQPPFARLVLLHVEGADRDAAWRVAGERAAGLRGAVPEGERTIQVLGPVSAPLGRLVGRWRFQVLLRGTDTGRFRAWLREVRPILRGPTPRGVRTGIDVDPRHLL